MRGMLLGALALVLVGCGGGGGGSTPPAQVASVVVTPADLTLNRGQSARLNATLHDAAGAPLQGRAVSWSSDDTTKVTVTETGIVRALGTGKVTIRAAAEGKNATAEVLVVEPPAAVDRVELDTVSEHLEEGASLQLEATVYDAAGQVVTGRVVQWSSNEPAAVSVTDAGLVTALRPAIATVTATVEGRAAAATIRVSADYAFDLLYGSAPIGEFDELYSLDINDPVATALPVFGPGKRASHAAPSPDGTRIAFVVHGEWDGTSWQSMIFAADRDGGNQQRLTYLPARNTEPVWSPDGSRIAFSSQVFEQQAEIFVMDADGANLVNLTGDQPSSSKRSPTWSPQQPNGTYRIGYAREMAGSSFIWSMRSDGSDKRALTADPQYFDSEPAWSPDGSRLVFQRTGGAIVGDLYLLGSTGGEPWPLLAGSALALGQFSPTWSPDGKLIAFTSKHTGGDMYQVWTVWADGTRLAQRTQDLERHEDPTWIAKPWN